MRTYIAIYSGWKYLLSTSIGGRPRWLLNWKDEKKKKPNMWVTWKKKCIFYGNVPAPCFICSDIIWVLRGVCTFAPSAHINPIGLRSLRLHSYDYSFTFCFLVQGSIPFLVFIFWTHTILNIISKCRNRMGRFSNETALPSWISTAISYFLDSGLYHNQIFLCIHIILFNCSWVSQGKNAEVVFRFLLQWSTFCQNSPPWSVLGGSTCSGS